DEPGGDGPSRPRSGRDPPEPGMRGHPADERAERRPVHGLFRLGMLPEYRSRRSGGGDAPAQDLEELPDPDLAAFRAVGLAVDQTRVELLRPQGVLEALGHPVEHGSEHLDVDVVADLASADAELHELERAVGILAAHEPTDRAPQA